jgi:hypothetical protein
LVLETGNPWGEFAVVGKDDFIIYIKKTNFVFEDKESFRLTLLKDIAYAVGDSNFPSSKLEIYSMKPAGASTQIYFSIIFPTGDTITAQSYGGGKNNLKKKHFFSLIDF